MPERIAERKQDPVRSLFARILSDGSVRILRGKTGEKQEILESISWLANVFTDDQITTFSKLVAPRGGTI